MRCNYTLVSLGIEGKDNNIRTPQDEERTETENRETTIYEVLEGDTEWGTTTETSEHSKKAKTLHFNMSGASIFLIAV